MSLNAQETSARDRTFQSQVRQAVTTTALIVSAESNATANHAARSSFATRALTAYTDDLNAQVAQAVVADGSTLPGATDSAVLARVAAVWNALAGGL